MLGFFPFLTSFRLVNSVLNRKRILWVQYILLSKKVGFVHHSPGVGVGVVVRARKKTFNNL